MQNLRLTTGSFWRFTDSSSQTIYTSLPDLLLTDTPLHHGPSIGFLSDIQHELLASILQVTVDSIWPGGLTQKLYRKLITTECSKNIDSILREVCDGLYSLKGFSLVGNGAFMQIPTAWGAAFRQKNITGLMWPFIPNINSAHAKGLRRMPHAPAKLGPDITALLLYSSCTLPKGGLQYWSIGNLTGRSLVHYHYGKTLRQRLFSAVLPGFSKYWKPSRRLPWVPKCKNNRGLEEDNKPPFWRYISSTAQLGGTANIRFAQARAIVLDPPELGHCDISNEYNYVFSSYRLLTEPAVLERITEHLPRSRKMKAGGIMRSMYKKVDHPSVSTQLDDGKTNSKNAFAKNLPTYGFLLPSWAIPPFVHFSPSQVIQVLQTTLSKAKANRSSALHLFLLRYAHGKQDVKAIATYCHTCCDFFDTKQLELTIHLTRKTTHEIQGVQNGVIYLYEFLKKGNTKQQKNSKKIFQTLTSIRKTLWQTADNLYCESNQRKDSGDEEFELFLIHVTNQLRIKAQGCWQQFLIEYWETGSLSLAQRNYEYLATKRAYGGVFLNSEQLYINDISIVKGGREFARTYKNLQKHENAELRNSESLYTSRYFWRCMNKAKKLDTKAFQPLYEQVVFLLEYIKPVENGYNFGRVLSSHKHHIHIRRVEHLFASSDQEMLIDATYQTLKIIFSKKGGAISLDFGVLVYDLSTFHFKAESVKRSWANHYFNEDISPLQEDTNVQT